MNKLWLVKDVKSRVSGPYSEEEILQKIEEQDFDGEEQIASYPSGRWKPLAAHSIFYEKLLKVLSRSGKSDTQPVEEEKQENIIEPTVIIPKKRALEDSGETHKRKKVKIRSQRQDQEGDEFYSEVIEMEDVQKGFVHQMKKAVRLPLFILFALAVGVFFYKMSKNPTPSFEYRIRLSGPIKKSPALPIAELKDKKMKAIAYYLRGDISAYLKSQVHLARILEGQPDFLEGYQYLCLIYLELWPFSHQDTADSWVLKTVMEKVGTLNQGGLYSGLCNGVKAFLEGNYKKTGEIADSFLNVPEVDKMIPYFYYLKAKAFKKLNRINDALVYTRGIKQLLPDWTAPYMLAGKIHYKKGEFSAAVRNFQKALSLFPEHKAAGLLLGIMEYNHLKKIGKAEKRLLSFLTRDSEFVGPEILKEAYMVMAKISRQQQDKSAALQYAMKAYVYDPSDEEINVMLTRLGGKKPDQEKVKTRQMVYKGDLLKDQGKCLEAQKLYAQAYEIDKKKNALAAVRMAQCFWQRGISGQATQWLKRAITADPKRMESYFLLSDYLSAKYAFEEAKDILGIATRQAPNSYEIFKGYALVAFRQKSYNSVIYYGKRALNLYSSDIEVHLILSKAYRALGQRNKEFHHGEKAVLSNPNSTEAQINFGWAKSSAYGFVRGEKHFKHLIKKFPLTIEYRQALGEYYFKNERHEKALKVFEVLSNDEPDSKPPYTYLGRLYSQQSLREQNTEKLKIALKYFLKAALLDPSDPEPLFQMGMAYMQREQYLEAESQFERILGINSKYPLIHYYIGKTNFLQGGEENLKRALKASKIESKKNPNLAMAYILTGDIYKAKAKKSKQVQQRRNYYELCVKEYQKAVKLRQKDMDLYVKLINCYRGAGELDSALQLVSQVVANHGTSGYPELYRQLGLIYELKGDYENARSAYKNYFVLLPGAPDKARIEERLKKHRIKIPSKKSDKK